MYCTYIPDRSHCSERDTARNQAQQNESLRPRLPSWQNTPLQQNRKQLQRMYGKDRFNLRRPCMPTKATIEARFTIQPRSPLGWGSCFFICRRAYLQPRNAPLILTRMCESSMSSLASSMGTAALDSAQIPALFTILQGCLSVYTYTLHEFTFCICCSVL